MSGLGRNTSEIISSPEWSEIINAVSSSLQVFAGDIYSVLKIGRIFTEKAGLINESLVEMLIPYNWCSLFNRHLGTSIAVSDNVEELSESLEKYGKVIIY